MEVKEISYDDTKPFILGIHYARRMPCIQYAYGLFDNNKLIGVVTYGQPATPSIGKGISTEEFKNSVLELNRLVILPEYNGKNCASMLVGRSLKLLPPRHYIVSYADIGGWGHNGYIYQATNFYYTGTTKPRTDTYGGHARHRQAEENRRQIRTAKHRYITITGNKRDKKELLKLLRYPIIKEYPKGDNVQYDTKNPEPVNKELGKPLGEDTRIYLF